KEQGRVYNQEFGFRVKSGEIHNMLFSIEQIKIGDEPCLISVCNDITQRKQAEKALHDSEEKFSKAFHASPEIIAITTIKDDKYLDINESYTYYTGYTREELLDRTVDSTSIWNKPGDRAEMLQILEEQGGIRNKEYEFRTKSGEIRTRLFSAEPITIGGEKCLLSASIDITERKQMEEALKSSEEKYRELISTSLDGIISMDSKMKITIWNQGAETIFGYTEEEMLGQNIFKIVPENVRESMLGKSSNMAEADLSPSMNHAFESIGQKKDGTIIPIDLSLTSQKVDGKFVATAIMRDISERKRMEETLADEAIRRRILIEQSSDGIVIIDQNGKVYDVNRRFADMLGYTMEEALKLNIWDWDFQWTPEVLLEKIKNVNSDGDHFTTLHKRKDGTVYDVDISTNGATFAGQKLVFCVCRDISERTLIEKALRESEEKFSLAFNASPHMIIITDVTDGKYIEVNDAFVNCTGYTREEFIGHNVSEFDLWDKPEEMEKMTRLVQEHGRFRNEEYDFRTKSGEIRTWLCSADVVSIGGQMRMLAVAVDITERKNTQEALRESEERFSRAFNASPISLSISRLGDGIFLEVNESFLRDKGYTRDEVIGHSSKKLRIWATMEEQNRIMDMLKKQGRVHNEQVQYRTKSGYIRTGLISAEVISIGNESCMLILNNDITQQKQAEEQLRLLSSVTKQVSDSTIVTDPEFRINFMNQAAEDLFGYSIEEVRGKNLGIFNKTPPTNETNQLIKRTLAAGKVYSAIVTKQRKDGTTIICDCRLSPLYDEKGQICSLIDVQRDITKQKDVEDKLQEHKKLIDSILATMPEGVLVIDSKDRILLANKALYQVLHLNRKSLKNKLLSEVLPVDQYFNLHRAVKDGQNESNTLEFRHHGQGFEKIIYCIIVKMDGERTLLTFSDVSKEREEEEKLYLTDRLASIGEMAAGLAHELNNPLTGILTLSQLLVSSETLEENKEDLECIHSEAKRAAGIVKNVLLFARNKIDDTGRASVNEVIKDVLRLREYEERASNIKVLMDLEENIPDIPIDKGQLQQVFLNIISNAEAAIKEANRPGILTVASQRVNNHVNILFTDNGCGIKKQIMPRLFDPFFTTKEVGKGTGLGLSICYSIIVKHGGKITVKSQVNEGSTFTIRMPIEM
ncbi:MAG: hypothetical protein A2Y89_02425, partial [Chloroflexi bacterium RBG_13_51_18]